MSQQSGYASVSRRTEPQPIGVAGSSRNDWFTNVETALVSDFNFVLDIEITIMVDIERILDADLPIFVGLAIEVLVPQFSPFYVQDELVWADGGKASLL